MSLGTNLCTKTYAVVLIRSASWMDTPSCGKMIQVWLGVMVFKCLGRYASKFTSFSEDLVYKIYCKIMIPGIDFA